jgi:hypothetical protein
MGRVNNKDNSEGGWAPYGMEAKLREFTTLVQYMSLYRQYRKYSLRHLRTPDQDRRTDPQLNTDGHIPAAS